MPRYYFHVREAGERILDEEGTDLPDLNAAGSYAVHCAGDILRGTVRSGELPLSHAFEITDADGELLLVLPFREAVNLT